MINFRSKNSAIRQADRITRTVNSVYPHISESKSKLNIDKFISKNTENEKRNYTLSKLKLKNSMKLDNLRNRGGYGFEQFRIIIENLKKHKIGNCYEESVLAQIIGKINGIKNIYPASVYYTKSPFEKSIKFYHAVAIITDKPFAKDYKYQFKNKDAIIVDPWLGITEFAREYFNRLITQFAKEFPNKISDNTNLLKCISRDSKSIEEFNTKRRQCFKPEFFLTLHDDEVLSEADAEKLKQEFPELIFNNQK